MQIRFFITTILMNELHSDPTRSSCLTRTRNCLQDLINFNVKRKKSQEIEETKIQFLSSPSSTNINFAIKLQQCQWKEIRKRNF